MFYTVMTQHISYYYLLRNICYIMRFSLIKAVANDHDLVKSINNYYYC